MSEENINQEQQVESTPAPVNMENKPKSNKKIIIAVSTIVSLIIIAAVVVFFVISNQTGKIAKDIETYLNNKLEEAKTTDEIVVQYEPFKCNGLTFISCKSNLIVIGDVSSSTTGKNIVFNIKPGVKTVTLETKGDYTLSLSSPYSSGSLNLSIDCNDNAELVSDKGYVINDIKCNNKVGNITNKVSSIFYVSSEEFQTDSFIELFSKSKEQSDYFKDLMDNADYALKEISNNISGKNLAQDIVDMVNKFDTNNQKTLDDLRNEFNAAKKMMAMLGQSNSENIEDRLVDESLKVADNVLNKNHNNVDIVFKAKDNSSLEDLFFLGFTPKLYEFSFSSK